MRLRNCTSAPTLLLIVLLTASGRCLSADAQQLAAPLPAELPNTPSGQLIVGPMESGRETLEDAWQVAVRSDLSLKASQWNLSAATRSLGAARAELLPSMTLGADYISLSQEPAFKLPPSAILPSRLPFFEQDSGGVHAMVKQPIYTSGRITHGIDAAEFEVSANRADLCRTKLDVKMKLAEIYILVLRAVRLCEVASHKVTSLAAHALDVEAMSDKGLVAKTDLLSARVALANARQQFLAARNSLDVARASYNRALGRPLTAPVNLAEPELSQATDEIEQLTGQAIRCRPEIAKLSAQACQLREQAASLQATRAPQIGLVGGVIYQQDKYIDPNAISGVAVMAEWNIIDSGRVCHQSAALRQKAEALIRARKDLESQVSLEVRQRWLEFHTALQQIEVAHQAAAEADENIQFARQRYQQQVGTNTEVLEAETLRVEAYTNLYNSSYEAVLAQLRLRRASGAL
ncbi:MAG TPA: TolC family protein [Thermoguttaceae bacterium]|nr:TolC family protein [Thermoguttaceae bacterium]